MSRAGAGRGRAGGRGGARARGARGGGRGARLAAAGLAPRAHRQQPQRELLQRTYEITLLYCDDPYTNISSMSYRARFDFE